jgi:predicted RNase H-like HicB family nuclease
MRPFIAIIRKEPNIGFCVTFPDLPDCMSSGGSVWEARENAEGALAIYCRQLHDADLPIPTPSWLREITTDQQQDGLVALIRPPDDVMLPRGITPLF